MRQQARVTVGFVLGVVIVMVGMPGVGEAQTTTRVSVTSQGEESNGNSGPPALSADGRFVAFHSFADNLVAGDGNGQSDIFLYDRQTGVTTRVSVALGGGDPDRPSLNPALSANGRFVAFESNARNLVAGGTFGGNIFVYDRQTGTTTRVSVPLGGGDPNGSSGHPALSADGRFVAFQSTATNLVPIALNEDFRDGDIYLYDRLTGTTTKVSVALGGGDPNGSSGHPALSADGRFVAFWSSADDLVPGDTNGMGVTDIFVHDRQTGVTTRVSVPLGGGDPNGTSGPPALSANGRFVAFQSTADNLVAGDGNGQSDIFLYDRQTGVTTRVSVALGGGDPDFFSINPAISADGRFIAFESNADNLVAGGPFGPTNSYVYDRQTGTTTRVSVPLGGGELASYTENPAISGNGRIVAFDSVADNLVPGDTNRNFDIFVHDRGPAIVTPPSCSASIGMADLVWRNTSTGDVASWLVTGLTLTSSGILWCGVSLDWQIAGIGDLDGNGTRDLVWRNTSTGDVAAWLMTASGVASMGMLASGVPLDWQIAGVNDLDGNGKADVVWRNTSTRDVAGWLMNGLSLETPGVIVSAVPTEWVIVGIGDVDGDNKDDIVWRNTSTGDVAGWLMNGLSLETPGVIVSAVPAEWIVAGLGDLNNNGTADLVWRNTTTGDVAGWLMNGLSLDTPGVIVSAVPAEWAIVGSRDLDDNGTADLVWRNMTTGDVAGWLMNGLVLDTPAVILNGLSLGWELQP